MSRNRPNSDRQRPNPSPARVRPSASGKRLHPPEATEASAPAPPYPATHGPLPATSYSENGAAPRRMPDAAQPRRKPRRASAVRDEPRGDGTTTPSPRSARRWRRWLTNWKVWVVVTLFLSAGSGTLALAYLLQLPGLPNCPAVFWPLAPASVRFECARIAASKQTAKDLLEAIALLDGLPPDHPMRPEADRLIEELSHSVLDLTERLFHDGKLDEAIAAARKIPAKFTAHSVVEARIKRWQEIWSQAEQIYKKAEDYLRQLDWHKAFTTAVRLLDVENKYWQTTKYNELSQHISTSREDGKKLGQAHRLADSGGLANLVAAIKLADEIRQESYVYGAAQKAIGTFGRRMLDLAQTTLDQRNLKGALDIAGQIPEKAKLTKEVRDFTVLANAQSKSWQNTVSGMEEAISQAQRIEPGRPLYGKAQKLIAQWQLEIEALAQLEKARAMAGAGTIDELTAAINQALQINRSNPRWGEAQAQIRTWQQEIEVQEDQPVLEQADAIASQGGIPALNAAIQQARQVGQGRALYRDAQRKISAWTQQIQQIEDQPLLDQAQQLADGGDLQSAVNAAAQIRSGRALSGQAREKAQQWTRQLQTVQDQPILEQAQSYAQVGNWRAAIDTAEQIRPGRALYNEAQAAARPWREQLQSQVTQAQAERHLQEANRLAGAGSPNALAAAIQVANQVSERSTLRSQADNSVNAWSWQLLQLAKEQAWYNPGAAIAIAQKIPSRADSYAEAQAQIQSWRQALQQRSQP